MPPRRLRNTSTCPQLPQFPRHIACTYIDQDDISINTLNHRVEVVNQKICAICKATLSLDRCISVAINGRAVHMEFNIDGSEVWVSDLDSAGAVIVLDSTTLTEIRRFTGLTPTGKFNVYNTANDIY